MIRQIALSAALGILFVLCSPVTVGAYDLLTATNQTIDPTSIANFTREGSRYTVYEEIERDSSRQIDRTTGTIYIYDNVNHRNYSVADGEQILSFMKGNLEEVFAFVKDDEVYYIASPEKDSIRITNDSGMVRSRWEMVNQAGRMLFSPSDKYLAYTSRPANVFEKMIMTTYERGNVYDYNHNLEYPKTGENRSANVSVSIWSVETNKSITITSLRNPASSYFLLSFSWVILHEKELLLLTWANRWQNETTLELCDYEKASCTKVYEHKYQHGQWAMGSDYKAVHSNESIFIILPRAIGNNSWQHIARLDITTDYKLKSLSFVPSGEYDVRKIVSYRSKENVIFYEAQAPHPWNQHVYGSPAGEHSVLYEDQCLTCVFSNCTFQSNSTISSDSELKIDFNCKGPSNAHTSSFTYDATLRLSETKVSPADSTEYVPTWQRETILLSSGYEAIVNIYAGNSTHDSVPVTLSVYGGPNYNQASDEYAPHLCAVLSNGFQNALVHIDVRGSGGRGWRYRSAIYGRLLTVEVEDTLEAMRIVLDKYPKLDKNRVAVFGGSYGGAIATALVETAPAAFFKCAVVVAPVTNFIYYYAQYTERYMGEAPLSTYTDLTLNVAKFNQTNLLLIHGLRDGNVHFQNSALLIEALQKENIPFELMVYPNQGHSNRLPHFDKTIEQFISACHA